MSSLEEKLLHAERLLAQIRALNGQKERESFFKALPLVQDFLHRRADVAGQINQLSLLERLPLLTIIALGQGDVVLRLEGQGEGAREAFRSLASQLSDVESFYSALGGLAGYYTAVLRKISEQKHAASTLADEGLCFRRPRGIDLCEATEQVANAVLWGLESLPYLAEIYPIGGSGDRLGLVDEESSESLPAACLKFGGYTLIEGLVRDLQARESLYYKVFGRRLVTPICMMTSADKDNHRRILEICEQRHWFGRPRESFRLFQQGLVPVISEEGNWCLHGPLTLVRKPGGHGALWQLMRSEGIYDWLEAQGRTKALIRQINNPVAGVDHGLLALTGYGCHCDKQFGFAACHRKVGLAEGVDVLIEAKNETGYTYVISNIEYTEFEKYGIEDVPREEGSPFSLYPSNTNILFADLRAVREASLKHPVPGMLVNLKRKEPYIDPGGHYHELPAARLESTMQNIADYLAVHTKEQQSEETLELPSFVTYNERHKTISVTKNLYVEGQSWQETPVGAYLDLTRGYLDLLESRCHMELPERQPESLKAPIHLQILPALGPLYSTIASKIQGGRIQAGSELVLEIDQLQLRDIDLSGSLLIRAESPLGHQSADGWITYGEGGGKCILRRVMIENDGIDWDADNRLWAGEVHRLAALDIRLKGSGEFHAEGVTFKGPLTIDVEDGERVTASERGGQVVLHRESIKAPTWHWRYELEGAWIRPFLSEGGSSSC